jgi:hypothetical protein
MAKKVWKQKVVLDKPLLARMGQFYSHEFDDSLLSLDCFSHPSLYHHDCNPIANLPGDVPCRYCRNVFGAVCKITCHISQFCLMMLAYRLGIGGEDFEVAYQHNSKLDYEQLYMLVRSRFESLEKGEDVPIKDGLQLGFDFLKSGDARKVVKPNPACYVTEAVEEVAADWVTLNEAAEIYECTYANIFAHVKRGNLSHKIFGGVKKVRKSDLLRLKRVNG